VSKNVLLPIIAALSLGPSIARSGDQPGVTYTISAAEALNGPKPADPNCLIDAEAREARINVDAGKLRGRVNPLVFGACFEDLNHEIYGGLYAQMLFGESFEEGPEKELPPGWRLHADWLKLPVWEGMWCSENNAIGMTGFRWYKLLWEGAGFDDGTVRCELMQPAFDPGRPIGLVFRASGQEFRDAYSVALDAQGRRLELRSGERGVAGAPVPVKLGQWLPLRIEVQGGHIRVFSGGDRPAIDFLDPQPLPAGLVGVDASESHGWFRNLTEICPVGQWLSADRATRRGGRCDARGRSCGEALERLDRTPSRHAS
jgi:hypothetical protein